MKASVRLPGSPRVGCVFFDRSRLQDSAQLFLVDFGPLFGPWVTLVGLAMVVHLMEWCVCQRYRGNLLGLTTLQWPYTYDTCDVGTLPNQTYPGTRTPVAAVTNGDPGYGNVLVRHLPLSLQAYAYRSFSHICLVKNFVRLLTWCWVLVFNIFQLLAHVRENLILDQ